MKNLVKYICLALTLCIFTQCSDYLEVKNPGQSDDDFVTSSPDEAFKMLSWCYGVYRLDVAHGGNYNFQDPLGSDAEYMTEYTTANNTIARLQPEAVSNINERETQYNQLNVILARCERIAEVIAATPGYQSDVAGSQPTAWTQLYGEAKTLWALCAFKLAIHFGDVPFGYANKYVTEYELTSRFEIFDQIISELQAVEGKMYRVGEGGITAERMNRSYANALIGQAALYSGSWQTIRTDVEGLYGSLQFTTKGTDDGMCVYARRNDYMDYIRIAEQYLDLAVNANKGTVRLITTDSRPTNNPFQVHWQIINSRGLGLQSVNGTSPESFYEVGCIVAGGNEEHPYSQGRPGSNGTVGGFSMNVFGAIRIIPTFFYKAYEEGDKRRDVSMVISGTNHAARTASPAAPAGAEALIPLGVGTRIGGGGPSINKWDFNRGDVPNFPNMQNRSSGMNYTVLKMSDAMLMLAEAKAILGTDNAGAVNLVNQIRERAFGNSNKNIGSLSGDALLDAIYAERSLELLGEGAIRWDMIRSGKLNERAIAVRAEMNAMMAGLEANGYYTFPSGRTISNYVWIKYVSVDGTTKTTQDCTDETDPARFPGWRGVFNWDGTAGNKNLAIKGLYEYIDPNGPEAAALVADGYVRQNWGIDIWNVQNNRNMFDVNIFSGIVGRENKAPRYYHPMPLVVIDQSKGKVTNGYGLPNK